MKTDEKKPQKKEWKNHKGEVVPEKYVSGYDKRKEKVLVKISKEAKSAFDILSAIKKLMLDSADELEALMYKAHSMKKPDDAKGNITFYSFDKEIRFTNKVQDIVEFDDKIKLAQDKINIFLEKKSKDADQDLMLLVNNAFKTNKGRLDKSRIFSLFQLKITQHDWVEAMELIKQSITTNHTRRYASIALRNENGDYEDVQLNISSI